MADALNSIPLADQFLRVNTASNLEKKLQQIVKSPRFLNQPWAEQGLRGMLRPAIDAKKTNPAGSRSAFVEVHKNKCSEGIHVPGKPDRRWYTVFMTLDNVRYPIMDGCNLLVQIARRALGARDVTTSRAALLIAYSWASLLYHEDALPVTWSATCVEGNITVADCEARLISTSQTAPGPASPAWTTQPPTVPTETPIVPAPAPAVPTQPHTTPSVAPAPSAAPKAPGWSKRLPVIFSPSGQRTTPQSRSTPLDLHAFVEGLCGTSSPGSWQLCRQQKLAFSATHFAQFQSLLGVEKGAQLPDLQTRLRARSMVLGVLIAGTEEIGGCGEGNALKWLMNLSRYLRRHPKREFDLTTVRFIAMDKAGMRPVIDELRYRSQLDSPPDLFAALAEIMTEDLGKALFIEPCWRCKLCGAFVCDAAKELGIPLHIVHDCAEGWRDFTTWTIEGLDAATR